MPLRSGFPPAVRGICACAATAPTSMHVARARRMILVPRSIIPPRSEPLRAAESVTDVHSVRASLAMTARFGIGGRMIERDAISPSPSAGVAAANRWDAEGDHERAVDVLAAASNTGDIEAMTRLGKRLLTADRAPYLPDQGTQLIVKGANLGGAEAAAQLAVLAAIGMRVPQS